jgi:hypothetical protein
MRRRDFIRAIVGSALAHLARTQQKATKALGITVPPTLLAQAQRGD